MNIYKTRIEQMKELLAKEGIDYYLVPTADFHNSEYVNEYFTVRKFLSGFTGSAGTLVISQKEAGLWTDGRYFVQADKQLAGSDIVLYRMAEEGVPTVEEYIERNIGEGQTLGFDGRVVYASMGLRLEKKLAEKHVKLAYNKDVANELWSDRPPMPATKVWVVPENMSGKTAGEKLAQVREKMAEKKVDNLLIAKLDDIMWLYNIRANDVENNPVALSYTLITKTQATIFIQKEAISDEVRAYFDKYDIICRDYTEFIPYLESAKLEGTVGCSMLDTSFLVYKLLGRQGEIIELENPTAYLKAVKNPVELENIRKYYLLDSVTLTKFLFWMKRNAGKVPMDEYSVAMKLDGMRAEIEGFLDLSFTTISAYKENAAMMHYSATADDKKAIEAEGFYLVDSGGQYVGGTTDVTRTIALGAITDEMKKHFSKTTCGMLRLADTKFLYGCTGKNVDIMAREPLWECYIDYKCGTGHGIGYILNVHEGPQNIRWRFNPGNVEAVLEEGMIVSDEPGVYIEGSHGIRIENILEVVHEEKNGDGQFMGFRHLTYVPIDLDAIDTQYMEESDVRKLNDYHAEVYKRLAPYFEGEELEMLKNATRAVSK